MANSGWTKLTLGELVDAGKALIQTGPFGTQLHSYDYTPFGVPVVPTEAIGWRRLIGDRVPRISAEKADELSRHRLKPGDILFARRGIQATGLSALVEQQHTDWICGTGAILLRLQTPEIDPVFLSFFLIDETTRQWLRANAVGAVMPNLNEGMIKRIPLCIPPRREQDRIANILGTLDDKIELNRRMNGTLEAMARRLFKSWFVDFDPVHAKAALRREHPKLSNAELSRRALPKMAPEIAEHFPDNFEDSTLGPIPKGWVVSVLDDLTEMVIGGDWGKDAPCEEFSEAVLCIRGADIPDLQLSGLGKMPTRHLKPSSVLKRGMRVGDLAFEISGGSPTQSTGRPVLVTQQLLDSLSAPLTCSNFCRLIRPADPKLSCFLYYYLRYLYDADDFLQYENGTTGIKNFAFTTFSSLHGLVVPTSNLTMAFASLVQSTLAKRSVNGQESRRLIQTRDRLLPRLLSGNLSIPAEVA